VCNRIPDVTVNAENIFEENQKMSKLPRKIRIRLKGEAQAWDSSIAEEKPEEVSRLLEKAELFLAQRPPRQPVSVRLDPFDLAMLKRIARQKGLPFTQLMSLWLHEKIEQEKARATS
jgi:predicted DNA binding CopG/RHH family protein